MSKNIKTRIQNKHDIEANWSTSTLVPLAGELIIYDKDDTHDYVRFKVGDGETLAARLPFATDASTIVGDGLPTTSTVGHVGQYYIYQGSGASAEIYVCSAITSESGINSYYWDNLATTSYVQNLVDPIKEAIGEDDFEGTLFNRIAALEAGEVGSNSNSTKMDKITNGTEGNFVALDAHGNASDSGKNINSFAPMSVVDEVIDPHVSNTDIHITAEEKAAISKVYVVPFYETASPAAEGLDEPATASITEEEENTIRNIAEAIKADTGSFSVYIRNAAGKLIPASYSNAGNRNVTISAIDFYTGAAGSLYYKIVVSARNEVTLSKTQYFIHDIDATGNNYELSVPSVMGVTNYVIKHAAKTFLFEYDESGASDAANLATFNDFLEHYILNGNSYNANVIILAHEIYYPASAYSVYEDGSEWNFLAEEPTESLEYEITCSADRIDYYCKDTINKATFDEADNVQAASQKATADWLKEQIATDDEIVDLLIQDDVFPVVADSDGSVLADENENILLW